MLIYGNIKNTGAHITIFNNMIEYTDNIFSMIIR